MCFLCFSLSGIHTAIDAIQSDRSSKCFPCTVCWKSSTYQQPSQYAWLIRQHSTLSIAKILQDVRENVAISVDEQTTVLVQLQNIVSDHDMGLQYATTAGKAQSVVFRSAIFLAVAQLQSAIVGFGMYRKWRYTYYNVLLVDSNSAGSSVHFEHVVEVGTATVGQCADECGKFATANAHGHYLICVTTAYHRPRPHVVCRVIVLLIGRHFWVSNAAKTTSPNNGNKSIFLQILAFSIA